MIDDNILRIVLFISMILLSGDAVISIFRGSELKRRVEALEEALEKKKCLEN